MVRLCKFRFQQGVIKILYIFREKLAFRVCGADHHTTALGSALRRRQCCMVETWKLNNKNI